MSSSAGSTASSGTAAAIAAAFRFEAIAAQELGSPQVAALASLDARDLSQSGDCELSSQD